MSRKSAKPRDERPLLAYFLLCLIERRMREQTKVRESRLLPDSRAVADTVEYAMNYDIDLLSGGK